MNKQESEPWHLYRIFTLLHRTLTRFNPFLTQISVIFIRINVLCKGVPLGGEPLERRRSRVDLFRLPAWAAKGGRQRSKQTLTPGKTDGGIV